MPLFTPLEPVHDVMKDSFKYSRKVSVPQYLPKNEKPHISSLTNCKKYKELMANINASNVSDEEKQFLKMAASRHIAFDYSLIADYYAHADKEMQQLMEESALVIIDIDDAIMNGYVKLSKRLEVIRADGKKASEFN